MRSLRKPDFLRASLLSARKPKPRSKSTKPQVIPKQKTVTAEVVTNELRQAALTLQKIAGKSTKRRKSADLKDIKIRKQVSFNSDKPMKQFGLQIEPLFDPVTKVRLFHIASHNLHESKILTRNIMAD